MANKKVHTYLIIGLLLLVIHFFWYQVRPSIIVYMCSNENLNYDDKGEEGDTTSATYEILGLMDSDYRALKNHLYDACLHRKGLK